ncbi:MAG: hypothetical protein E6G57_15950 [Actinobacteria bacterium]|nr:MAG: hypothetical protein E6G57_15950 [Actinomycetota bacterium]
MARGGCPRRASLLNLDLVFTPTIPVPRGVWALGPELSRRVPLGAALAWASTLIGGPLAGKLLLGGALAIAFAGVWRLLPDAGVAARLGAGLLYAGNPFTLTRVAVGHWGVVAALAVLPWALPVLLRPGDDLRRTWLWSVAIGATGVTGGMFGLVLVVCGLVADSGRRALRVAAVFLVAQLPWLIPGAFTLGAAGPLSNPRHYATRASVPFGVLRVFAGGGFWRGPSQLGAEGAGGALLGAALLGLAIVGARRLPAPWRARAAGAAAVGVTFALVSGMPGLRSLFPFGTASACSGCSSPGWRQQQRSARRAWRHRPPPRCSPRSRCCPRSRVWCSPPRGCGAPTAPSSRRRSPLAGRRHTRKSSGRRGRCSPCHGTSTSTCTSPTTTEC